MTKMKEGGSEGRSPPAVKQSPAKRVRCKITDSVDDVESGPALESVEEVHREFSEAIDLTGISEELQQKMYAVAPVLCGRAAIYSKEFFCNVVGLCGKGISLKEVQMKESEILVKWPVRNSRYEIADCLDRDEAEKFSDHWHKVYGESPDNSYYSMRFLRGCYATFVHDVDVNWAEEALERRRMREGKRERNPKKLGPVALRQQVAALCKIIADLEASPTRGTTSLAAAKVRLEHCKQDEVNANNRKLSLLKKLHDAKEGLQRCYAAEDSDELNIRYTQIVAEAKHLRSTGNVKDASAKRAEGESLLATMNERSNKLREFEDAVLDIEEELLPKAVAELKSAKESVAKAEEKVKELTICPGCRDGMKRLKDLADGDPVETPNCGPHDNPESTLSTVAKNAMADPPNAAADDLDLNAGSLNSIVYEGHEPVAEDATVDNLVGPVFCSCE